MKVFRHLAVAAFAVLLIASASAPSAAQEPKGTLIFAVESLAAQTLDPILEGRPGNAVYQAAMYDSLVGFDLEKGGVGPGVAERWAMSEDGLSWTFYLRAGQLFHNGDPLTAHDVKFSLERQMSPTIGGRGRPGGRDSFAT
jgi:peptide/nickel transport system substrate-binding protein